MSCTDCKAHSNDGIQKDIVKSHIVAFNLVYHYYSLILQNERDLKKVKNERVIENS